MNKQEYVAAVQKAVTEFIMEILPEFPDELNNEKQPSDLQQANDELMLAVYEYTKDGREP